MNKLKDKNPQEMYIRAKSPLHNSGQDIQFYQFQEWIQKDLTATITNREPTAANGSKLKLNNITFGGFGQKLVTDQSISITNVTTS